MGLEGGVGVRELNSMDPREKVPHRLPPTHTHTLIHSVEREGGKKGGGKDFYLVFGLERSCVNAVSYFPK